MITAKTIIVVILISREGFETVNDSIICSIHVVNRLFAWWRKNRAGRVCKKKQSVNITLRFESIRAWVVLN